MRAITSPKREVGGTTLAKLAEMAQQAEIPLSKAAENIGMLKQLTPRAAAVFLTLIRRLGRRIDSPERGLASAFSRALLRRSLAHLFW